ncbi:MAG TPA: hypothetical protein VIY51_21000 [Xanthobacteraceae bacterium]
MLQTEYILNHIDALVRLSHDVKDRAVSAKLREMADEIRIMVSVADITSLAAGLSEKGSPFKSAGSNGSSAVAKKVHVAASEHAIEQAFRFVHAKYSGISCVLACPRVGAP